MMISTGEKDKKDYTEFKYAPSDITIGTYYDKETGEYDYYNLLNLENVISVTKKEFEPYDRFINSESGDYGRVNHSVIELNLEVYNKELNTTNHYYINSESEPRVNEIIQGLKDYGFVMSEGTVEECYYNYLSVNRFGKFTWEMYERK